MTRSGPSGGRAADRFGHHHLRLAVQQALPLLPLLLGPAHASPLRDGVDDADQGGEDHDCESDQGQGQGDEVRRMEIMPASYRTG